MMATRRNASIQKQGLDFQYVIDANIAKFHSDKVEGFGIVDHSVCSVEASPQQSNGYIEILEQRWQNFKPQESASFPKC